MIRSKATMALERLKEIDKKYKLKQKKSSSSSDSVLDSPAGSPRLKYSGTEQTVVEASLRPKINIRIPDPRGNLQNKENSIEENSASSKSSKVSSRNHLKSNSSSVPQRELNKQIPEVLKQSEFNENDSIATQNDSTATNSKSEDEISIHEALSGASSSKITSGVSGPEKPGGLYGSDTFEDISSSSLSKLNSQNAEEELKTENSLVELEPMENTFHGAHREKQVMELVSPKVVQSSSECEIGMDEDLSDYVKIMESLEEDPDEISPVSLLKIRVRPSSVREKRIRSSKTRKSGKQGQLTPQSIKSASVAASQSNNSTSEGIVQGEEISHNEGLRHIRKIARTGRVVNSKEMAQTKEVSHAKEMSQTKEMSHAKEVSQTKEMSEAKEMFYTKEISHTEGQPETEMVPYAEEMSHRVTNKSPGLIRTDQERNNTKHKELPMKSQKSSGQSTRAVLESSETPEEDCEKSEIDAREKEKSEDGSTSRNLIEEVPSGVLIPDDQSEAIVLLRKLNREAINAITKRHRLSKHETLQRESAKPEEEGTASTGKRSTAKRNRQSAKGSRSGNVGRERKSAIFDSRNSSRLRRRMVELRLQQEREDIRSYLKELEESRIFCNLGGSSNVGKRVPRVKPLELPNIASYQASDADDTEDLRSSGDLEKMKNRVSEIRQWLKDQYGLYREYSKLAQIINTKYIPTSLENAKKMILQLRITPCQTEDEASVCT